MIKNTYISELIQGLGFAFDSKNNNEIIVNYPIKYDKKNMKYIIDSTYNITYQKVGTFLADFLNTNYKNYEEFLFFFNKYSFSLLDLKKLKKQFNNGFCSEDNFTTFIINLQNKNEKEYLKLQKQTDMILDYCLLNPSNKTKKFSPIQRFYVLRRISPNLSLLNNNRAEYYSVNLFSSYLGKTEKEIYNFLAKKGNEVLEYDLILPHDISSIIYKSLVNIFKGKVYLKICKNCGKYFIANRKSIDYCNNIISGETTKTCRDVGRSNSFKTNKDKDKTLALYYKIYNRKAMMASRNSDIEKYIIEFARYKEIGKKKLQQYKNGKIDSFSFQNWIKKNT